jgi:Cd2+/Zn2+-exporting ATPase
MEHDPTAALTELGFTEYEAKTYVALLRNNPATGYQISKEAGIPRSMVYEALGRLSNRGAVMSLPTGDTTRYAPIAVHELLDKLRHRYEDAIDVAQDVLEPEEQEVPIEQVWNIDGREAVLARAREMLKKAQHELLISVDDRTLVDIVTICRDAHERGVRVRFLLPGDAEVNFGEVTRHPQAESALQKVSRSLVVVADGGECLIGGTGGGETCIWTGNRQVVFIARQYILQEFFTQKLMASMGSEISTILSPEERLDIFGEE